MSDNARAGAFFIFGIKTARQVPVCVLSVLRGKWDNIAMEKLLETLKNIGLPDDEIARIKSYYATDLEGPRDYVSYMRLLLDDRHEYV